MFNGLSLEQAPPISVVLRFFLTLPVFGLLLSFLMIIAPHELLTLGHPFSLASIHLLFLGIVSMGMIGALFQMQSVLGGRPIPLPLRNSLIIHTLFTLGVFSLVAAFAFGLREFFMAAGTFLGGALLYFTYILLPLLFGTLTHDTLKGMRLTVMALLLTATLGIVMAASYVQESFSEYHAVIRTAHYSIGLIGWISVLIIYVAFQVVEMFYVTTPYSDWCKRNAKRTLTIALLFKIIWLFSALPFGWVFDAVIGLLLIGFVVTTTKRLRQRKRRVSDISIWFWFAGLALLMLAIGAYWSYLIFDYASLALPMQHCQPGFLQQLYWQVRLAHLRCLLAHLRCLLAHLRCLLAHLRCLLAHLRCLLAHLRCLAHLRSCWRTSVACWRTSNIIGHAHARSPTQRNNDQHYGCGCNLHRCTSPCDFCTGRTNTVATHTSPENAAGDTVTGEATLFGKHNLTPTGANTGEICAFCHTPQGSESNVASPPLWNRTAPP